MRDRKPGCNVGPLERSLRDEQANDLVHEERIAVRLAMHGMDERGRRIPAAYPLDEEPDVVLLQAAQR